MTNEAWKATRCEVTIRDDGRVLDPGGCAIGSVQPTQPVGFWMGRDDRHRIISYHDTAHEAAIAVHDRARLRWILGEVATLVPDAAELAAEKASKTAEEATAEGEHTP